jgi:hypothetical protein
MKILIDPVYTGRPSTCSTSYLAWEIIDRLCARHDDAIQQLGWDRFDVTDPEVFKDVDEAFEEGDYDKAQDLIDAWKAKNQAQKGDPPDDQGFEGPYQPKKKRRDQSAAGREQDYDDIARDSSNVAFDSGVSNDERAPIAR